MQLLVRVALDAAQARASARFGDLRAQCRKQPEIVEERWPQVLDYPPLDVDPRLQRFVHAPEMRLHFGILRAEALLDPRDVHASRDQEAAELIVQLARQRGLLLLGERLQVCRQLGQLLGALLYQPLELGMALGELGRLPFPE